MFTTLTDCAIAIVILILILMIRAYKRILEIVDLYYTGYIDDYKFFLKLKREQTNKIKAYNIIGWVAALLYIFAWVMSLIFG
mgnify:CR=1 FL=1